MRDGQENWPSAMPMWNDKVPRVVESRWGCSIAHDQYTPDPDCDCYPNTKLSEGYALIVGVSLERGDPEKRSAQWENVFLTVEAAKVWPAELPLYPSPAGGVEEFQAVYLDGGTAQNAANHILIALGLFNIPVRYGIGYGPILVIGRNAWGQPIMDGPAWWSAREDYNARS